MYVILGASGLIGSRLREECHKKNIDCIGTSTDGRDGLLQYRLGEDDPRKLLWHCPQGEESVLVLAAGITSLRQCYEDRSLSERVNVTGTRALIDAAAAWRMRIVYLSSDAVFAGIKGDYSEEDVPDPICTYGEQKYEIEQYLRTKYPEALVLRLAKQYDRSRNPKNLFFDIYREAKETGRVRCIRGLTFNPTDTGDTAACLMKAVDRGLTGLYHLAALEKMTRYELARRLVDAKELEGITVSEEDVEAFDIADAKPLDTSMQTDRLANEIRHTFLTVDEAVRMY